jgi:small subunit ribosomal protein S20
MAVHKSAIKRARQSVRRNLVNRQRRSVIHALTKSVEEAIAKKDTKGALEALRAAEAALARGAGRGTLHWKTAARKTSRLAKRVKALKSGK